MRLFKVALFDGTPAYINPDLVTYVRTRTEKDESWTEIHFSGNDWTGTRASLDEVARCILEAK